MKSEDVKKEMKIEQDKMAAKLDDMKKEMKKKGDRLSEKM